MILIIKTNCQFPTSTQDLKVYKNGRFCWVIWSFTWNSKGDYKFHGDFWLQNEIYVPRSFVPGRFRPVWFLFRRFPWPRIPFNVSITGSVRFWQSSDRKRPGTGRKFPLNFRPESGAKELAGIRRNRPGSIETVSEPTQFWTDPFIWMIDLGSVLYRSIGLGTLITTMYDSMV